MEILGKVKFFVVSCSSDSRLDARSLYVWGEMGRARWLPETEREAGRRIRECRRLMKCAECDAQIHEVRVNRTKSTLLKQA